MVDGCISVMPIAWNWEILYVAILSTYTWPHNILRKAHGREGKGGQGIMTRPEPGDAGSKECGQDSELWL